ncbi:MAG: hypothetical protein WCD76_17285 [Pyrinomonadaceae bacterium]
MPTPENFHAVASPITIANISFRPRCYFAGDLHTRSVSFETALLAALAPFYNARVYG